MPTLSRFGLLAIAASLLTACSPKQHQPITTGISFITQAPDYLLEDSSSTNSKRYARKNTVNWLSHQYRVAKRKAADNNAAYIAFYSDQLRDRPVLTPAFSYVTAMVSGDRLGPNSETGVVAEHAILASNIDFGMTQSSADVFAYNPNKARADVFEQQEANESIAYLSLIKQTHSEQDAPPAGDLAVLAHSVDRLATQGRNKIVLLSQYDAQYNTLITEQIKGLDVLISAGEISHVAIEHNTCLATFAHTGVNWQTLYIAFDADGNILQCSF